jgi:hypothetical protein
MKRFSPGFGPVEMILVVVALGIIGGLGFAFYNSMSKKPAATTTKVSTTKDAAEQAAVPTVNTTKDLTTTSTSLDELDLNDTDDSSQLETEQSAF